MRGAAILALIVAGAGPSAAQTTSDGRALFGRYCSIPYCHGPDGGEGRAPALRGGVWSREALGRTIVDGVADTSMPPFQDRLASEEVEAIVAFILSIGEEVGDDSSTIEVKGDAAYDLAAGRALFYEGRCAACHRFGREDLPGPDLRRSAEKSPIAILRDILEPGRNVEGAKPFVRIHMSDGASFDAIVQQEAEAFVRANDLSVEPYVLRRISRDAIDRIEPVGGSAMPTNLTNGLSPEQIRDLVFFIRAGGDKDSSPEVVHRDAEGSRGRFGTLFLPVTDEAETLPAIVASGLAPAFGVYLAAEGFAVLDIAGDADSEDALEHLRSEAGIDPDRIATWASDDEHVESLESAITRFREQLK